MIREDGIILKKHLSADFRIDETTKKIYVNTQPSAPTQPTNTEPYHPSICEYLAPIITKLNSVSRMLDGSGFSHPMCNPYAIAQKKVTMRQDGANIIVTVSGSASRSNPITITKIGSLVGEWSNPLDTSRPETYLGMIDFVHNESSDTFTHTYKIKNKTLGTNNPLVSLFVFGKQYTDKQAIVSDGIVTLTF